MTTWLGVALVFASVLSFWAGMRVERKRRELEDGMGATLEAIDRDRDARNAGDRCDDAED